MVNTNIYAHKLFNLKNKAFFESQRKYITYSKEHLDLLQISSQYSFLEDIVDRAKETKSSRKVG